MPGNKKDHENLAEELREGTLSPDDFFEVKGQAMDFDEAPPRRPVKRARHGSEFEDPESPSFVVRHMRGIVGLLLLIFTVAIFAIWAVTPSAQDTLAKLDLAWSATAYERLGLEAYQTGDFSAASHYFSQALSRDPDNEAYVTYAVNSYIELGNMENAASILRKGISAQPYNVQYYTVLMDIYSGYENLSDADKALIDDGYRRTGDSRLDYSQMED